MRSKSAVLIAMIVLKFKRFVIPLWVKEIQLKLSPKNLSLKSKRQSRKKRNLERRLQVKNKNPRFLESRLHLVNLKKMKKSLQEKCSIPFSAIPRSIWKLGQTKETVKKKPEKKVELITLQTFG
jgi:hypothetical protein